MIDGRYEEAKANLYAAGECLQAFRDATGDTDDFVGAMLHARRLLTTE